jgi:hypothetical protein
MRQAKGHLSYANVMATLAVVLAAGGGTAAIAISSKAPKNSVIAKSIKRGNVTASKLAAVRSETVNLGVSAGEVRCQDSERLLTGGANVVGSGAGPPTPALALSQPTDNGWKAAVVGPSGTTVSITVVCLSGSPSK